ncbi:MAG TPA: phosphoribosyltransferase family protein [Caulobacteraceae bacterium]|jgi:hypoxanthine phosphoribosyltransferase
MTDTCLDVRPLLGAEDVARRVEALADSMVHRVASDSVAVCLLLGGLWFAADLTRAFARRGHPMAFDALWLSSYGEGRESAGQCEVRAGLQRPVAGRQVLVLDDVADSGASLAQAVELVRAAGAREVITAVFARKPWPGRVVEPDFVAWEAPSRFLVGYGMDLAGAARGLPYVGTAD